MFLIGEYSTGCLSVPFGTHCSAYREWPTRSSLSLSLYVRPKRFYLCIFQISRCLNTRPITNWTQCDDFFLSWPIQMPISLVWSANFLPEPPKKFEALQSVRWPSGLGAPPSSPDLKVSKPEIFWLVQWTRSNFLFVCALFFVLFAASSRVCVLATCDNFRIAHDSKFGFCTMSSKNSKISITFWPIEAFWKRMFASPVESWRAFKRFGKWLTTSFKISLKFEFFLDLLG